MPKTATIYHNPRCSKSRAAVAYLQQQDIAVTIIEYLKLAPTTQQIAAILEKLDLPARDVMRRSEPPYKTLELAGSSHTEEELISFIHQFPILLERPIVVCEHGAAIGRPLDNVIELLESDD